LGVTYIYFDHRSEAYVNRNRHQFIPGVAAALFSILPSAVHAQAPQPITTELTLSANALDMDALKKSFMGYMPASVQLSDTKPDAIHKEPAYKGKPKYGAFVVGNGPKSFTYFAVDEPESGPGKIYIDKNQNGDLTDDGPGNWDKTIDSNGVANYQSVVTVNASWGGPVKEDEQGSYTLMIYKQHGTARLGLTKFTARSGKLTIGGKTYPILLAENNSDGMFINVRRTDRTRRPLQLFIDLDGDGTFRGATTVGADGKKMMQSEQIMLDQPFQIGGQWWEASTVASGAQLTLIPTSAPGAASVAQAPRVVEERKLLAAGVAAPNFTAMDPTGKPIHLSDFKGKIVLLDLWATWCGPCQQAMPGLEEIYRKIKDKNVVVLSLNVFDEKAPFDAWIKKNAGTKYSFTFAFDPAERDSKKSIAATRFGVSAIPTMFVIGTDGIVQSVIVGSGNEGELKKALLKLGVDAS
jgi:thiol-disulfide isomerase/thioredoxin